jgi:predicted metal-dependent hydrolase
MSGKSARIAALIDGRRGQSRDAHYLAYFDCFNQGLFFEAHDVLEELWLAEGRQGANHRYFKGLIQLAGAFVHLQKNRLQPAIALFNLAEANLRLYPAIHEGIDVAQTLTLIDRWRTAIRLTAGTDNPLKPGAQPTLAPPAA